MDPVHQHLPFLSLQRLNEVDSLFAYKRGNLFTQPNAVELQGMREKVSPACSWNMLFVKGNKTEMVGCNQCILGLGHLVNKLQAYALGFKV